jgi:hypothetical protein
MSRSDHKRKLGGRLPREPRLTEEHRVAMGLPKRIEDLLLDYDIAKVKMLTRCWLDDPPSGAESI